MSAEILTSGIGHLFFKLAVPGIIGTLILGLYNFIYGINEQNSMGWLFHLIFLFYTESPVF